MLASDVFKLCILQKRGSEPPCVMVLHVRQSDQRSFKDGDRASIQGVRCFELISQEISTGEVDVVPGEVCIMIRAFSGRPYFERLLVNGNGLLDLALLQQRV